MAHAQEAPLHLEALVTTVRESSSVSVLDGDEVVYVARVPMRRIMTVAISVGTRFPAFATSMGRVLHAGQSDQWLDGYLATVQLSQLTRWTITDPARLRSELMRVRQQGWAMVSEELEEGLQWMRGQRIARNTHQIASSMIIIDKGTGDMQPKEPEVHGRNDRCDTDGSSGLGGQDL